MCAARSRPYAAPSGKLLTDFRRRVRRVRPDMRLDREVDVLVFGAGMGGMTAALVAVARRARRAPVREDRPGRRHHRPPRPAPYGFPDRARRCATACRTRSTMRGASSMPRSVRARSSVREAFLAAGPEALDYLEARSEVKFIAPPSHPDYHSNQPGRALAGRALAPLPFDGRLLGKDFEPRAPADRAVHGARRHDGRQDRHSGAAQAVRVGGELQGGGEAAAAPRDAIACATGAARGS